jgi:pilus assembly protein CpaB
MLALISGLAAAWLALNYVSQQPDNPIGATRTETTEVVVAATDLPLGHTLTATDIKLVDWPGEAIPEGYTASVEEVLGRGLIVPVAMNEPLLSAKIAVLEAGGGLPIVIPDGMRGISVRVDEVVGVAGFVLPSTRVDVLVTLDQGPYASNPVTRIVLQNMAVLTSGQVIQQTEDGEPITVTVITLLASPEEAEQLVLAATKGRIQLALRNTLDLDSLETRGVRLNSLVPAERVARRAPSPRRVTPPVSSARSIEVYRGHEVKTETVDEGGSQ